MAGNEQQKLNLAQENLISGHNKVIKDDYLEILLQNLKDIIAIDKSLEVFFECFEDFKKNDNQFLENQSSLENELKILKKTNDKITENIRKEYKSVSDRNGVYDKIYENKLIKKELATHIKELNNFAKEVTKGISEEYKKNILNITTGDKSVIDYSIYNFKIEESLKEIKALQELRAQESPLLNKTPKEIAETIINFTSKIKGNSFTIFPEDETDFLNSDKMFDLRSIRDIWKNPQEKEIVRHIVNEIRKHISNHFNYENSNYTTNSINNFFLHGTEINDNKKQEIASSFTAKRFSNEGYKQLAVAYAIAKNGYSPSVSLGIEDVLKSEQNKASSIIKSETGKIPGNAFTRLWSRFFSNSESASPSK